jgi:hypothetical protein
MSADAPDMIVFGGRAEAVKEPGLDAVSRFNRMAMDNPVYGHNSVLERIASFDNSDRFTSDEEAELDAYVQTLFLEPLGEKGYGINGDPYGEFKKGYAGPAPESGESMYPELAAQNAAEFISQFGKIFAGNNN